MTPGPRWRALPAAARVGSVAAVAAFAVLAPIRMAQGAPKTRFAVVASGVTSVASDRLAAASAAVGPAGTAGPAVPPAPGPVVDSPFPLSHLGARWVGSEDAAVDIRLAGSDRAWGPWRAMPASHDLDKGDGGPVLSDLIRAQGATHAQARATGDARNVEIVAIDTLHGPRTRRLGRAAAENAAEEEKTPPDRGG